MDGIGGEYTDKDQAVAICNRTWDDRAKGECRATVYASAVTVGDEAQQIVKDLVATNKLFAALAGTPNASFFIMDLTTVGRMSQHQGPRRYVLSETGLDAALPTLISKPVHITPSFDGHAVAGQRMRPIGTFLGADKIQTADGITIRVIGTLWDGDFPDDVAAIRAQRSLLGGSYEIAYATSAAVETEPGVLTLNEYVFTGGAILRRDMAAHPETKLHHASTTSNDAGFQVHIDTTTNTNVTDAERTRATRRIIPSPDRKGDSEARDHVERHGQWTKKEADMATKYAGFGEEDTKAIDAIIADALARSEAKADSESLRTQVAALKAEMAALKESAEAKAQAQAQAHARENEANARAAAAETKLAEVEASFATAQTRLAELETVAIEAKAQDEWSKLEKEFGLGHLSAAEVETRMATVRKLVAGKERVEVDEYKAIIKGGRPTSVNVPLVAGTGGANGNDSTWDIKKLFPSIGKPSIR